jgi:regulator of replication initiation timing
MNADDQTELRAKVLFLEAKIANFEYEIKRLSTDRDHHLQSSIRLQLENDRLNAVLARGPAAPETIRPPQLETSSTVIDEPVREPASVVVSTL